MPEMWTGYHPTFMSTAQPSSPASSIGAGDRVTPPSLPAAFLRKADSLIRLGWPPAPHIPPRVLKTDLLFAAWNVVIRDESGLLVTPHTLGILDPVLLGEGACYDTRELPFSIVAREGYSSGSSIRGTVSFHALPQVRIDEDPMWRDLIDWHWHLVDGKGGVPPFLFVPLALRETMTVELDWGTIRRCSENARINRSPTGVSVEPRRIPRLFDRQGMESDSSALPDRLVLRPDTHNAQISDVSEEEEKRLWRESLVVAYRDVTVESPSSSAGAAPPYSSRLHALLQKRWLSFLHPLFVSARNAQLLEEKLFDNYRSISCDTVVEYNNLPKGWQTLLRNRDRSLLATISRRPYRSPPYYLGGGSIIPKYSLSVEKHCLERLLVASRPFSLDRLRSCLRGSEEALSTSMPRSLVEAVLHAASTSAAAKQPIDNERLSCLGSALIGMFVAGYMWIFLVATPEARNVAHLMKNFAYLTQNMHIARVGARVAIAPYLMVSNTLKGTEGLSRELVARTDLRTRPTEAKAVPLATEALVGGIALLYGIEDAAGVLAGFFDWFRDGSRQLDFPLAREPPPHDVGAYDLRNQEIDASCLKLRSLMMRLGFCRLADSQLRAIVCAGGWRDEACWIRYPEMQTAVDQEYELLRDSIQGSLEERREALGFLGRKLLKLFYTADLIDRYPNYSRADVESLCNVLLHPFWVGLIAERLELIGCLTSAHKQSSGCTRENFRSATRMLERLLDCDFEEVPTQLICHAPAASLETLCGAIFLESGLKHAWELVADGYAVIIQAFSSQLSSGVESVMMEKWNRAAWSDAWTDASMTRGYKWEVGNTGACLSHVVTCCATAQRGYRVESGEGVDCCFAAAASRASDALAVKLLESHY